MVSDFKSPELGFSDTCAEEMCYLLMGQVPVCP